MHVLTNAAKFATTVIYGRIFNIHQCSMHLYGSNLFCGIVNYSGHFVTVPMQCACFHAVCMLFSMQCAYFHAVYILPCSVCVFHEVYMLPCSVHASMQCTSFQWLS